MNRRRFPNPPMARNFWRVLLIISASIQGAPVVFAEEGEFKDPEKLSYKGLFLNEDAGTVAFLPAIGSPRLTRSAHNFRVMRQSGFYKIPMKSNYVFQINNVTHTTETRFVECMIYTIYPGGVGLKPRIRLVRNSAEWEGREYPDGQKRLTTTNDLEIDLEDPIETFRAKHKLDDLRAVDLFTRKKWHAWPKASDAGSWDLRNTLSQQPPADFLKLLKACGLTENDADIHLTVMLLHFTTAEAPGNGPPLDFYFGGDNARGAYIHIGSSPSEPFTRDLYLKFDSSAR